MKIFFLLPVLFIGLAGCATLTKTQVAAVSQFAQTSKNFSDYPSGIIAGLAESRIQRGIYYSNSLSTPVVHVDDLDSMYSSYKADYAISRKVDISFQVIDKYAQSLLLLSSDKHASNLKEQATNFGVSLDSLVTLYNATERSRPVPAGIGAAVSQVVAFGGKQYIKAKQGKEIKKFVTQANTLVDIMTDNLLEFLESTNIDGLIRHEEREIRSNYLSFLRQRPATVENERDYLKLKTNLDAIKKLRSRTVIATRDLRATHAELRKALQKKKTIRETIGQLQALCEEVKELKGTLIILHQQ